MHDDWGCPHDELEAPSHESASPIRTEIETSPLATRNWRVSLPKKRVTYYSFTAKVSFFLLHCYRQCRVAPGPKLQVFWGANHEYLSLIFFHGHEAEILFGPFQAHLPGIYTWLPQKNNPCLTCLPVFFCFKSKELALFSSNKTQLISSVLIFCVVKLPSSHQTCQLKIPKSINIQPPFIRYVQLSPTLCIMYIYVYIHTYITIYNPHYNLNYNLHSRYVFQKAVPSAAPLNPVGPSPCPVHSHCNPHGEHAYVLVCLCKCMILYVQTCKYICIYVVICVCIYI